MRSSGIPAREIRFGFTQMLRAWLMTATNANTPKALWKKSACFIFVASKQS